MGPDRSNHLNTQQTLTRRPDRRFEFRPEPVPIRCAKREQPVSSYFFCKSRT
jgi:hypothetical protein